MSCKSERFNLCQLNFGPFLAFIGPKFDFFGNKIGILTNSFVAKFKKNSFLLQIKNKNYFRQTHICLHDVPSIFCERLLYNLLYNFDIPSCLSRDPALRARLSLCFIISYKSIIYKLYLPCGWITMGSTG